MNVMTYFDELVNEWVHSPMSHADGSTSLGTTMDVTDGIIRISNNHGCETSIEKMVGANNELMVIPSGTGRKCPVGYRDLTKHLIAVFGYDPLPHLAPHATRAHGARAVVEATRYTLNRIHGVGPLESTYPIPRDGMGYVVKTPPAVVEAACERYRAVAVYCSLREMVIPPIIGVITKGVFLQGDNTIRVSGRKGWADLTLSNPNLPNVGFDHVALVDASASVEHSLSAYKFLFLSENALYAILMMIDYFEPYPADKWDKVDFLSTTEEGRADYGLVASDRKSLVHLLHWKTQTLKKALERHPSDAERTLLATGAFVVIHEMYELDSDPSQCNYSQVE